MQAFKLDEAYPYYLGNKAVFANKDLVRITAFAIVLSLKSGFFEKSTPLSAFSTPRAHARRVLCRK